MIISEMNVKLTASTSAFAKAMDRAGGRVKKFRAVVGRIGPALGGMARKAAAAAAVLTGLAWGAKKIFDLGASIEETGSKYATVFGPEASAEVSAFLDNFAAKAGLTIHEAKGLVATTGAIAQGLGFTQKASGAFATEITKLAGDLSSFNNIPTEEVLMGINSALTGEREQMKRLGVVILEADVVSKAFAQTGKTVAKALTQQEKATATLALITEKAGVAIGDLDRTSGSAANVAKRLGAQFREIANAFATALMPAFKNILTSIDNNSAKFDEFKQKIIENSGIISAWALVFVEALKFVGVMIIGIITNIQNMGEIFLNIVKMAKAAATFDWGGVSDEFAKLQENRRQMAAADDAAREQFGKFGEALKTAFSGGIKVAGDFETAINKLPGPLEVVGDGVDAITAVVENLDTKLRDMTENFAKNFVGRMTDAVQGSQDVFKGFFTWMKNQLIELAIKALLFKAIMGFGGKFDLDLGGLAESLTGFESAKVAGSGAKPITSSAFSEIRAGLRTGGGVTGAGAPGAGTPILSGRAANASGRGVIVNQNINFTVSTIDGQSAAAFIRSQGGTIAEVIATAAKDSTAYRRQLQGA